MQSLLQCNIFLIYTFHVHFIVVIVLFFIRLGFTKKRILNVYIDFLLIFTNWVILTKCLLLCLYTFNILLFTIYFSATGYRITYVLHY